VSGALIALDHVIVAVADLDAAVGVYTRFFGRAPSGLGEHPELGTANATWRLPDVYLELLAPVGTGFVADGLRARLASAGDGPLGFALATADADACAAALRSRGLAASDPVPGRGVDRTTGKQGRWRNVYLPADASRGPLVFAIEYAEHATEPFVDDGDPAAVVGIDHLVVRTDAPEAAIRFYGERLGLRLALDKTFEQWGARLLFFRVGGVTIEIAAPARPPESPAATDTVWGFSWRVPDVDAIRARLLGTGFDVSEVRSGRRPNTRVCTVRGPTCGAATLLIEVAPREQPGAARI
jgi:catechol 2,3-dioxygenase-like lactoylglutathione lyase family enzyme